MPSAESQTNQTAKTNDSIYQPRPRSFTTIRTKQISQHQKQDQNLKKIIQTLNTKNDTPSKFQIL